MAKIRIHELAKEIAEGNEGLDPKTLNTDIVKLLQDKGSDVKSHMSSIDDDEAQLVRDHYGKGGKKAAKPAPKAEPAKSEPVKSEPARTEAAEPAQTPAEKSAQDNAGEAKKPAQGAAPVHRRPMEGKLTNKDGKTINYKITKDGRLIDAANGNPLPFRVGADGRLVRIEQGRRTPDQRPGQNRPADRSQSERRPAQNKPVSQVFDGRSERDKRNAASSGQGKGNQGRTGNAGGFSTALGEKVTMFESMLEPVPERPAEPPKQKKNKNDFELPVMPKADKPAAEPVQETAAEQTAAPAAPAETPVQSRPQDERKPQNDRPQGDRPQGDRPQGERRPQGDRPQGERRPQGDRPQGERRPQGDRPYGDRRPQGDRSQGDRPYGDRRPQGDRPYGDRRPQGDRPQGDRPYGDRRPQGDRPYGDRRPQGDRPQGDRPYGDRRPQGDRPQGDRNYGDRRPQGDRNQGGFGGKDDDQRRTFTRRNDSRPSGGSARTELANEIGKDKRANSYKDKTRDKNRRDKGRDFDEDTTRKKKAPGTKGAFIQPTPKEVVPEPDIKTIVVPEVITIKELADKMKQPSAAIVKKLFLSGGKMVTLNSEITFEEAEEIALDYEIICEKEVKVNVVEELLKEAEEDPETLVKRPPVVCVMGHVDHGKTSLLDAIRSTNVTSREAGGITQHIGAYMVEIDGRKITFLDTPGHEAFTAMRMRGAQSTDIAILVVAADDGVMPQTVEAINHAKAAGVSIIVAVNKIDKPGANVERVKQELTEHNLIAEDWGGDTVFVPVSAKTGEGIENLLEMVLLTADVLELKANPDRRARGLVIEAQLDKGRGPVATVLVQKGTLNVGDNVAIGAVHGKVRAMIDDKGRKVKTATPSTPVELLGLNGVPTAGEVMLAVADEKEARNIAEAFIAQSKEQLIAETKARLSLDGLFSQIQAGEVKELNLIIKADVMGSVEAVKQSLIKLSNEEVVVRVIHGGVGNINESDVTLASASNAIIIGFNVKPDNTAKDISDREKVDVRLYRVIYDAIDDIEAAMKGMLKPIYREKVIGHAEIRQLFKASGLGVIAGSYVLDGKIERGCKVRISRGSDLIFEGPLASLKRFKDDVKEVAAGYECGLVFEKFNDFAELDQVEFYIMEEVPRT